MERSSTGEAQRLAIGGALLTALAAVFLWNELAIGAEYLLLLGVLAGTALALTGKPRQRPELGLILLGVNALVAGVWFAAGSYFGVVPSAVFHPLPLLLALGGTFGGVLAIALTRWERVRDDEARATRLVHLAVGVGMVASAAVYYQLFTVGIAGDQVARRMVLTLVWLAAGLALLVRKKQPALWAGGRILATVAFVKALVYDTTHLDGALRIVALMVTGGLLLGGSWVLGRAREAT